jgi:uncharacterized membrane protein YgcG
MDKKNDLIYKYLFFFIVGFSLFLILNQHFKRITHLARVKNKNKVFFNLQEKITSFKSDIYVLTDGTLLVKEVIEILSEQKEIVHGISREFPTKYSYNGILQYVVGFNVISVTHNDTKTYYHIENYDNGKVIYIGHENIVIPPGTHTYTIVYETNRQLGFFENFDQLYWNVTGNGWRLPIDKVEARFFLPKEFPDSSDSIFAKGYMGFQNEKDQNYTCNINKKYIEFSTNYYLKPYQGLTCIVQFPKGLVFEPSKYQKCLWFIRDNIVLILLLLLILLWMYGLVSAYLKNKPGLIVPLFYPPANMAPSTIGFMISKKFKSLFLSADILDLSIRGFIDIKQISKKHYTLVRLEQPNNKMNEYDELLLQKIFGKKKIIDINKKYNNSMAIALKHCENNIINEVKLYTDENLYYWKMSLLFWLLILYLAVQTLVNKNLFLFQITLIVFLIKSKHFFLVYTKDGRKIQDAIDGFKLYLVQTEPKHMNIIDKLPTKTPELYEKYLPYAIAMGIEKKWKSQFSSLFKNISNKQFSYIQKFIKKPKGMISIHSFSNTISSASTPPGSYFGSGSGSGSGSGGGGGGGGGW